MNHKENKTLRDYITEAIKGGRVIMRPRWHFVLHAFLALVGVVVVFLGLLYLISFIVFVLRHTGLLFVPMFGMGGVYWLLFSLPWVLITLSLVFVVVLEILVRKYAFAYRQPLLYSVLGILVLVVFGGIVIAQTSFHNRLLRYAREDKLPIAGRFYRSFGERQSEHVSWGRIVEKTKDGFLIEDVPGGEVFVMITPRTRFPFGTDFNAGDSIIVFGDRSGSSTISAIGVKKVDDGADPGAEKWPPQKHQRPGFRMK